MGESSGLFDDSSVKINLGWKCEYIQAAQLNQPRPNMLAPMHQDRARETVVNSSEGKSPSTLSMELPNAHPRKQTRGDDKC